MDQSSGSPAVPDDLVTSSNVRLRNCGRAVKTFVVDVQVRKPVLVVVADGHSVREVGFRDTRLIGDIRESLLSAIAVQPIGQLWLRARIGPVVRLCQMEIRPAIPVVIDGPQASTDSAEIWLRRVASVVPSM